MFIKVTLKGKEVSSFYLSALICVALSYPAAINSSVAGTKKHVFI